LNISKFVKPNAAVLCRLYSGVTAVIGHPDEGFSLRFKFSEQNIAVRAYNLAKVSFSLPHDLQAIYSNAPRLPPSTSLRTQISLPYFSHICYTESHGLKIKHN